MMFEVSNLISDALLVISLICIYKHPEVEKVLKPLFIRLFFGDKDLSTYYKEPLVQAQIDLSRKKSMQTAHWKYKLKAESSLMTRLKVAKKSVVILVIVLMKLSAFCEKVKNIIVWDDRDRSTMFLAITVIGYCSFAVIPLRMVALFACKDNISPFINNISVGKIRVWSEILQEPLYKE